MNMPSISGGERPIAAKSPSPADDLQGNAVELCGHRDHLFRSPRHHRDPPLTIESGHAEAAGQNNLGILVPQRRRSRE